MTPMKHYTFTTCPSSTNIWFFPLSHSSLEVSDQQFTILPQIQAKSISGLQHQDKLSQLTVCRKLTVRLVVVILWRCRRIFLRRGARSLGNKCDDFTQTFKTPFWFVFSYPVIFSNVLHCLQSKVKSKLKISVEGLIHGTLTCSRFIIRLIRTFCKKFLLWKNNTIY